jgi:hypothetical protein
MGFETASRSRVAVALVLCCWLFGFTVAELELTQPYQARSPLAGQGMPPEGLTAVVVDVSLDRILAVDVHRNSFEVSTLLLGLSNEPVMNRIVTSSLLDRFVSCPYPLANGCQ